MAGLLRVIKLLAVQMVVKISQWVNFIKLDDWTPLNVVTDHVTISPGASISNPPFSITLADPSNSIDIEVTWRAALHPIPVITIPGIELNHLKPISKAAQRRARKL